MEAIEVKTGTRTTEIVLDEIAKLNKLIIQRENWLADTANRNKKNYHDVKSDTTDMIWQLKELKEELDELKKAQ